MEVLLIFSITLLLAVLISSSMERSVLSAATLFLAVGFVCGGSGFNWLHFNAEQPLVAGLAEIALVTVLFTDGMRTGWQDLRHAWHLPGRALLLGMPITFGLLAVSAHYVVGIDWWSSMLIAAVLSPTDPVFAAAIVGRKEIPETLRNLLNVESGLNDGLALPAVLTILAFMGSGTPEIWHLVVELAAGVALGVIVPYLGVRIAALRWFKVAANREHILALSLGLIVFALCKVVNANEYLAAYSGGITIASVGGKLRDEFRGYGEFAGGLLKVATLLIFGALISPQLLSDVGWSGLVFAVLALVLARPLALQLALIRSGLTQPERLTAGWFGPKGFASVIYGIIVLRSGVENGRLLFDLIAACVALSILAHSSTDVPVANWFNRCENDAEGQNSHSPEDSATPKAGLIEHF